VSITIKGVGERTVRKGGKGSTGSKIHKTGLKVIDCNRPLEGRVYLPNENVTKRGEQKRAFTALRNKVEKCNSKTVFGGGSGSKEVKGGSKETTKKQRFSNQRETASAERNSGREREAVGGRRENRMSRHRTGGRGERKRKNA